MRGSRYLVPASLLLLAVSAPIHGGAQEATPAARTLLQPCTAEPRNIDELLVIWFDPAGAPLATPAPPAPIADNATLPEGSRADDATIEAIAETTQRWISCLEFSGQSARGFSYMTDNFLAQFGPDATNPSQDSPDEVRAALEGQLAATPAPSAAGGELVSPLVGPRRARVMDDGRAGALWSLRGNRFFFIYEQVDGRWLIDDVIDILEPAGTPVAGTPVP